MKPEPAIAEPSIRGLRRHRGDTTVIDRHVSTDPSTRLVGQRP